MPQKILYFFIVLLTADIAYSQKPVISSFVPQNGCQGTTITITGKYFTGTSTVNIGGKSVASYHVQNDSILTAVVGNSNTTGTIFVSNAIGSRNSTGTFSLGSYNVLAYIPNNNNSSISIINTSTDQIINTIHTYNPFGLSVNPNNNEVYATSTQHTTITCINSITNTATDSFLVGKTPIGICTSPDGKTVYVANKTNNNVSVISTASKSVINTISVGNAPMGLIVSNDGTKLYVVNEGGNNVSVIDTAGYSLITSITVDNSPYSLCESPDGSKLYVTNYGNNTVSVINTVTYAVTATIPGFIYPASVCITPDGSKLYVTNYGSNTVSVINTATNTLVTKIPVGNSPSGISVTPDGAKVYVINYGSGIISVINTVADTVATTINNGGKSFTLGNFIGTFLATCPPANRIEGNTITALGKNIKNVSFNVNDSNNISIVNNADSAGNFQLTPNTGNVAIHPIKNNDINKTNGVTTLDLALTQSHILGKTLLNSPYKIIAADVNGDSKITTLDLVYMKRLILGIDTTFTNSTIKENRLWAFVDSSYQFSDTTNPFPFKDSISFTGINATQNNQTFIGIKLGDVNWDWNPALARPINKVFIKPILYDSSINKH